MVSLENEEKDARWPGLLTAARAWRATLIPKTSNGVYGPTMSLLRAIEEFDPKPCEHPRSYRVFFPISAGGGQTCGYCGEALQVSEHEQSETEASQSGTEQ